MRFRKRLAAVTAVLLVVAFAGAGTLIARQTVFKPKTIIAYFSSASAIYPGDEVRVSGVKVGNIESIQPDGTEARVVFNVDHDIPIPADAKAVIVASNLVGARYVQLAPAYETSGPTMADGAVIGADRTAVPIDWDQVKTQLMRLSTDLGPSSTVSTTSVGRFIDSAATALDGNGEKLRQTISQLSRLGAILADGSGDIVDILKNLQVFVTALRDSNTQIVEFQDRLATVTNVIDGSRSDLDGALTNLSSAVVDVKRFVAGSRNQVSEQIQRLADVTKNLTDHQMELKNVLHVAPNAIANSYNLYDPDTGGAMGALALGNFTNPVQLLCSAIAAVANATASETGKLCAQYLGPALRLMNFNYLPFPFNAYLGKSPSPGNVVYSQPELAPGGTMAPAPAELPPPVSAYTGLNGDVPPPAGWDAPPASTPGAFAPNGLPANPSPALFPGAPIPSGVSTAVPAPSLRDMLLPAETPPAGGPPA